MSKTTAFQVVLDSLIDLSRPFPARYLYQFSDIEPENLALLLATWPEVPAQRKQTLLEDLEDLAEGNTLLCFDDLARAFLEDTDDRVRVLAIRLLWECQDVKLVPIFMQLLEQDSHASVRAAAASALGLFVYLGELEDIPEELLHEIEDHLLTAARSKDEKLVRRRALEALGTSSRKEIPPLIEAAFTEEDPDWKASALYAMGRSSDLRWKKQVLSMLRNKNDSVRGEAVQAAGELDLRDARPVLLNLLDDEEDLDIYRQIVWALSKLGGEGVRERLEELMDTTADDEEATFMEEALDNLSFTEDMQSFDLLDIDGSDSN